MSTIAVIYVTFIVCSTVDIVELMLACSWLK